MNNIKIFKTFFLSIFILTTFMFLLPLNASAQESRSLFDSVRQPLNFRPQVGIPGLVEKEQYITLKNNDTRYIVHVIKAFYSYGIGIAGILAAIMLMAGGLIWLTSAGSSEKITQAKNIISGSLIGLLLLFTSWMLLRTINPYLVDFRITDITGIENINFDGCCVTRKHAFGEQFYNLAELKEKSTDCEGTWYPEYIPNPNYISPSTCVKSGCCTIYIRQMDGSSKTYGSFPITQENCRAPSGGQTSETMTNYYYMWTSGTCNYKNIDGCGNKADGERCYRVKGTELEGYCYHGNCMPGQARIGEVCGGGDGQIGYCRSGSLFNRCPGNDYVHVGGGRNCISLSAFCCRRVSIFE